MKRINVIAGLILLALQMNVGAGVLCESSAPQIENQDYRLEATCIGGESLQLLLFTLPEDYNAAIKVSDSDLTQLAEGDKEAGAYSVNYKAGERNSGRGVEYILEFYRDQSKSHVFCIKENSHKNETKN